MESQRVKCLTEGYLRGWLSFQYPLSTSWLKEEIILNYIQEQHLYDLLQNKLFIETVLRSSFERKTKESLDPIFEVSRSLIELKLPSAVPKDTIKKDTAELKREDLVKWKDFLEKVNKK